MNGIRASDAARRCRPTTTYRAGRRGDRLRLSGMRLAMGDEHRPKRDERAQRVLRWLAEHRAEFEGAGVPEGALASALGLPDDEVTAAVDRLESREAVARIPHHDATQQGFLLQPARGWADVCAEFGVR